MAVHSHVMPGENAFNPPKIWISYKAYVYENHKIFYIECDKNSFYCALE